MTTQEVKTWLRRAWYIDQEIANLLRRHWEEYQKAVQITSQLPGMPWSASKDPHKIERVVLYESKIKDKVEELKTIKREITTAINGIKEPNVRIVLHNYYITDENGKHKTLEQIAAMLHVSERQAIRYHLQGISILSQIL